MRRIIVLVLVLLLIGGLYLFRGRISEQWADIRGLRDAPQVPSPELAEVAHTKIEGLRDGSTDRVALGGTELQSLVQYKYVGGMPAFASAPSIALDADKMRLRVRVPVDKLPNVRGLGDVANFLPDTADVELSGTLIPLDSNRVALGVDNVKASGIPLPQRMISDALRSVGRRDEPGLPKDALALKLPAGVRSAYIRNDSLILLARPRE